MCFGKVEPGYVSILCIHFPSSTHVETAVLLSKGEGDSSMIAIDTIAVENEVADNMYQRSELDYLIYNAPLEYADLILNGDPETYLKTVTEYKPWDS